MLCVKKLKKCFFLVQCLIFYYQFNLTTGLIGPIVRSSEENEFPYVVSIMRVNNISLQYIEYNHRCTGTLISKQDVITAEHCLRSTFIEGFKVMLGSHDLVETTPYYPLFIWTYEHWLLYKRRETDGSFHDIAFIKLTENVPDNIETAALGNVMNRHLFGLTLETAGWGRMANNSTPRVLQTARVTVLTKYECEHRIYSVGSVTVTVGENQLCTVGEPYAVLNSGDSGGPLLFYGTLVALNIGICPVFDGNVYPEQVNLHISLRFYQEIYNEMRTTFNINF